MARRYLSGRSLIGLVGVFFAVNFLTFSPALAGWVRGGRFNGGVSTPTPTPSPTSTPPSTPTPPPTPTPTISVSSLTLVDTDTYLAISPFDPIASGATINLATLPTRNLTIRANTSPATVGSVKFDLIESAYSNTVNTSPYYLCGPVPCSNLGVGLHSLTTTPYMSSNASGAAGTSMSISFSV